MNQVAELIESAAEQAARNAEDLVGALVDTRRGQEVLARAVDIAQRATFQAKITSLARVLAEAAFDEAKIDTAELVATALGVLELPHIRILRHVAALDPEIQRQRLENGGGAAMVNDEVGPTAEFSEITLAADIPGLAAGLPALLSSLRATGCTQDAGAVGEFGAIERVSTFGLLVLEYLGEPANGE